MGKIKNTIQRRTNALKLLMFWIVLSGILCSCNETPVETIFADLKGRPGVFISCEGNYMYGNASLSFYDKEAKSIHNRAFYARNRVPLGDVAQSLSFDGKHLYVVVNNSGKIVVLDPATLEYKGSIKGLVSPREIHFVNEDKAYISDLYARRITVFNPLTWQVTGNIAVSDGKTSGTGHPTESFAQVGNFVFVTCWAFDNKILVINTLSDQVVDSITVAMQPRQIVADKNNRLWVACEGNYSEGGTANTPPAIVRIDPDTRTVEQIYTWKSGMMVPRGLHLNREKDSLYYVAGDVFKMSVFDRKLPDKPFILASGRLIYSMGVDPGTGELYLSDAIDYTQDAMVYRYSGLGVPIDTFRVGINPGDYYFSN